MRQLKLLQMKKLLKFTFITLITLMISSCSSNETTEEISYFYESEKLNFTELIDNQTGKISRNSNNTDDYIHSEFETTFYIPDYLLGVELENYIEENQSAINGTLKYFINDQEFITIEIVEGQETRMTTAKMNLFNRSYPCTYDGIQDCVQYAVYEEWTTIEAIICAATGGLDCIAIEAAACIETNCF